jgi:hypothetical protein
MRKEQKLVSAITSQGFNIDESIELLSTPPAAMSATNNDESFDVRADAVFWWNDLEKDKRYKRWPKSIMDVSDDFTENNDTYLACLLGFASWVSQPNEIHSQKLV